MLFWAEISCFLINSAKFGSADRLWQVKVEFLIRCSGAEVWDGLKVIVDWIWKRWLPGSKVCRCRWMTGTLRRSGWQLLQEGCFQLHTDVLWSHFGGSCERDIHSTGLWVRKLLQKTRHRLSTLLNCTLASMKRSSSIAHLEQHFQQLLTQLSRGYLNIRRSWTAAVPLRQRFDHFQWNFSHLQERRVIKKRSFRCHFHFGSVYGEKCRGWKSHEVENDDRHRVRWWIAFESCQKNHFSPFLCAAESDGTFSARSIVKLKVSLF